MPDGGTEHPVLKTPIATVSTVIPFTRNTRPKVHAPASAAAVRESQSVPRPPKDKPNQPPTERPSSPPKADPVHLSTTSQTRPSPMPRSQTTPALTVDVNKSKKPKAGAAGDDSGSEICVSPSWSDFGGAKKKKEKKRQDKERKEEEKKLKKEEAKVRAADLKGAKRLSKKPPPAAMETQRMPSGLRRNSIVSFISSHSSSGENTRNSRDERRHSGSSIDSSRGAARSRSTPGTSTELRPDSSEGYKSAISPVAPQLPVLPTGLGWHSRTASSAGTDRSKSWGSEDAYEKELVTFARQIQQATQNPSAPKDIIVSSVKVDHLTVQQPKRISGAWPIGRSHTDPEAVKVNGQLKVINVDERPSMHQRQSSDDNTAINGLLGHRRGHLSGTGGRPRSRDSSRSSRSGRSSLSADRPRSSERPRSKEGRSDDRSPGRAPLPNITGKPQSHHTPATYRGPPLDGGSYVHKQRMHQQQLSLEGWADEQAVRMANELAIPEEDSESEEQETFVEAKEAVPSKPRSSEQPFQAIQQPKRQMEPPKPPPAVKLPTNRSPDVVGSEMKKEEPTTSKRSIQDGLVLRDARKSAVTTPSPTSPTSPKVRVSSLLGFGRRQKSDQDRQSVTTKAPDSDRKSNRISPPPPVPKKDTPPPLPHSAQEKFDTVKAQKAVESKASHKPQRRSETAEIVQSFEPTQTAFQSHSRTRTSSSQLLTDDLPVSRPLPRSTTTPVLPSEAKLPSAMADRSRNESPSKNERKSVTFERSTTNGSAELYKLETTSAKAPEIIVEGISPEGLVRQTSITRPRSNPNLQLATANPHLPSLDFLPELKHQPLPKRTPNPSSFAPTTAQRPSSADRTSQFPAPSSWGTKPPPVRPALPLFSSSPNLQRGTPVRPESYAGPSTSGEVSIRKAGDLRRQTLAPQGLSRKSVAGPPDIFGPTPTPSESAHMKPVAKLFVICCKCNYWHDLPSHLYEAMCLPQDLTRDPKGQVDGKGKAT
ncbi:MAG: hypothetical protein Q9174_005269, partial [Haloplaca sp. 1 TL-2023]